VLHCYKRFDSSFNGPAENKSASSATTSYGIDTNWYFDTEATDHVTGELEKLSMREKYHGGDQVHTANGSGMEIDQIGHSNFCTPSGNLLLKNILYVPKASKNLVSVHKLARDNHAFFEFHPNFFLIKDQTTMRVLHRGPCERALYPLKSNKEAHVVVKPLSSQWHMCLGHPSSSVVHQVLSKNKLPFTQEANKESVCDACQKGKCHQLPYPRSTSVSSSPLELVFSNVWGPAPTLVSKNTFYVSFIDDYNKFTWIYLLRHKFEVFQRFHDFQSLVERMFDRKIIAMQTDWGVNIRS
jgi:histone deacetylase 1/2